MTAVAAPPDQHDPELESFRAEVRAWLDANAQRRRPDANEFKRRFTATSTSMEEERAHVVRAKEWQRKIFDAGFAGITVPIEYGGRGGTSAEQRVWQQEVARYEIDTGVFSVGAGGASSSASLGLAPTSPASPPRPSETATSGS
jgi:acyl-CoA dehydrogenase